MPAKKSNRNKKSLKMHSAKKLGSVKPLSVDPSLVTTSVASQPSSHTSTKEIFNFSLGAASPAARGGVPGEGNSNIPNMIVNVSKIKP